MLKSLLLFLTYCALLSVSRAQTTDSIINNASIDVIIKNSPLQLFVLRNWNQNMTRKTLDSVILGEHGVADTIHSDIYVEGRESHLSFGYQKKKLGYFAPVLEPGDHVKMILDFNNPDDIVFSGSARTQELYNFIKASQAIGKNYLNYVLAIKAGNADSIDLKRKIDTIKRNQEVFARRVALNTQSAFVLINALYLSQQGIVNYTPEEFNELRAKFKDDKGVLKQLDINEKLQQHPVIIKIKQPNGTYLANFTLPDIYGKPVSLGQFKGKYVLVDFWASWCGPCRQQAPYLKKAFQQFGKNNFMVLSISLDEKINSWKKAILQDSTQAFVQLIDVRGKKSPISNQLNVQLIPSNFLIDPTGKIIDKDLKGDKLLTRLSEIIPNTKAKN